MHFYFNLGQAYSVKKLGKIAVDGS